MAIMDADLRIENENELLALVLNKNEVIELLQIKPEYLVKRENQKMLKYAIECYKEHKVVLPVQIMEKHKDFDIIYYTRLLTDVYWKPGDWKQQLNVAQESIFKAYKEDYIKALNEQLQNSNNIINSLLEQNKNYQVFL